MNDAQNKRVVEVYSSHFDATCTPGLVIYHLIKQKLIPENEVRNFNICYDFIQEKRKVPAPSHTDIMTGLVIKYSLSFTQVRRILKDEREKYEFL